jgi:hypothetical protein
MGQSTSTKISKKVKRLTEEERFQKYREHDLALQDGKKSGNVKQFERGVSEIMISHLDKEEVLVEGIKICLKFLRKHERIDDHYFSAAIGLYSLIKNKMQFDTLISWLTEDIDDSWSQLLLSLNYEDNDIEGITLIYKSCLQNNAWAQMVLGDMYKKCSDFLPAVKWLCKSVEQGNTLARASLEECLEKRSPQYRHEFDKMKRDIEINCNNPGKRSSYQYPQTIEEYLTMKEVRDVKALKVIHEYFNGKTYVPKDIVNIMVSYQ